MNVEPQIVLGVREPGVEYAVRPGAYALLLDTMGGGYKVGLIKITRGSSEEAKYYLLGGGIEDMDGGDPLKALAREAMEESGYEIRDAIFECRIDEFFYSPTMDSHFKKEGYFYEVTLADRACDPVENDHELVWLSVEDAYDKVHHLCARYLLERYLHHS